MPNLEPLPMRDRCTASSCACERDDAEREGRDAQPGVCFCETAEGRTCPDCGAVIVRPRLALN
jgi:hypothetical protein